MEDLLIFVTNLGRDQIILGLPWFQALKPTISWKQGELLGDLKVKTSSKVFEINKTTLATRWAIQRETDKKRLSEKDVPEHYEDYSDVFSEEKAKSVTVPHGPSLPTSVLGFCCGATCLLTFLYDSDQYDHGVGMNKFDNVSLSEWIGAICMVARQSRA
jgi:hypothetical protein